MRHWRFALVLIVVLSLSNVLQAATAEDSSRRDSDVTEMWLDTRSSDAPLRGKDVVRRPEGDMPDFSTADFEKTWTLVVDGTKEAPGACGYSLNFTEPIEKATPKVFTMTAVDLATCQVEFTVGIPTKVERLDLSGMEIETFETGSEDDPRSRANANGGDRLGYLNFSPGEALIAEDVQIGPITNGGDTPLVLIQMTLVLAEIDPTTGLPITDPGTAGRAAARAFEQQKEACKAAREASVSGVMGTPSADPGMEERPAEAMASPAASTSGWDVDSQREERKIPRACRR